MKIVFVQGHYEAEDGTMAVWSKVNDRHVRGFFEVISEHNYNAFRKSSKFKTRIVVVKQKSWWKMSRTLCHELAHWFVFTFITKEEINRYDKWIDR